MKKLILLILVTIVALTGVLSVSAQESETPEDGVSVTVYNQGTALIQDRRTFTLEEGVNIVNFTDVASSIDSTSASGAPFRRQASQRASIRLRVGMSPAIDRMSSALMIFATGQM